MQTIYILETITSNSLILLVSDLAHKSEQLLTQGLSNPAPITLVLTFFGGLLTSLGPCSLSLLPITLAYLAGFNNNQSSPIKLSLAFCSGIVLSLIFLGSISGFLGRIYGEVPSLIPTLVAVLAIFMGLNLFGLIKISLPIGPDPEVWRKKAPKTLAPIAAGLAFGLASSPCSTPVLAVLLGWIAQTGRPFSGVLLLASFGAGQVLPLLLAGTVAASVPKLLSLKPIGRLVPYLSGFILVTTGFLTLLARWT